MILVLKKCLVVRSIVLDITCRSVRLSIGCVGKTSWNAAERVVRLTFSCRTEILTRHPWFIQSRAFSAIVLWLVSCISQILPCLGNAVPASSGPRGSNFFPTHYFRWLPWANDWFEKMPILTDVPSSSTSAWFSRKVSLSHCKSRRLPGAPTSFNASHTDTHRKCCILGYWSA